MLGRHGVLTPEQARKLAVQKLAAAASGEDLSAGRHAVRADMTVGEVCDWYLEEARSGRLLGRSRHPIKESTLASDEGRINLHIKPLIGARALRTLTLAEIERMQADIARGLTTRPRSGGRGGAMKGGAGVAGRSVATLRAVLRHAKRWKVIANNPALGVRQIASTKRTRRLVENEVRLLGAAMRDVEARGDYPVALAALRILVLTGFRRMEVLGLKFDWVERNAVAFPDTKSGPQTRAIGQGQLRPSLEQGRGRRKWRYHVRSVELERLLDQGLTLIERRDAFELMRVSTAVGFQATGAERKQASDGERHDMKMAPIGAIFISLSNSWVRA